MRATTIRLSRGFWGRSYDELKRLSSIAIRAEGVKGPSGPYELRSFADPAAIDDCKLMTDAEIGGFSTAEVDWVPSSAPSSPSSPSSPSPSRSAAHPPGGYLRFRGTISTRLPSGRPDIQRTGYAAWRTADMPPTVFGRTLWNVDSYGYLALRVRSDGRSYLINVQTDSMVAPTDLHQHRLFARRPGQWETVVVPWSDFVRTNHGFVVEPQTELLRQKVRSVGVGLTDRVPGPFELCVARLWATNDPSEADSDAAADAGPEALASTAAAAGRDVAGSVPFAPPPPSGPAGDGGGLKNKEGRPVRWDTGKQAPQQQQDQPR